LGGKIDDDDDPDESESGDQLPVERDNGASNFMSQFGWIYNATIVADHERITLDETFNLPTIQFLNDLAFLKAKSDHENYLMKKSVGKIH
jgi:hypothetical protein